MRMQKIGTTNIISIKNNYIIMNMYDVVLCTYPLQYYCQE